ncbi:MAG: glutamate synthase central domain-containing protein [Pararobbsia sp.]
MFAQVTNPPIDPIRENMVMSLVSFVVRSRTCSTRTM